MGRRRSSFALLACLVSAVVAACGGDDGGTTTLTCGEGTSANITPYGTFEVTAEAGADLRGAAVHAQAATTAPSAAITIACADDIVPDGYIALGPAVTFGPVGAASDRPFEFTLPYKAA